MILSSAPLLNVTTLTGIFCWALCSVTFAGSWQPPSTYKRVSDNERHQVTVTAPIEASKTKSQIIVAKKLAGSWSKTWSQNAVNPVVPLKAFLTDDGSRVITLGNWGGRENSDDSLVVYSHNRVLARYTVSDLAGVEARVPMTSVGSGWLIGSHTFLDVQLGFALWLDFAEHWVLVDLKNGTLRTLTPKLIKQCEEIARAHLLARIEADEATFTDYQLLSRFLRPEDAILFEPLLNHPYQHLSCGARHQNNKIFEDYGLIEYISKNNHRDLAEAALNALAEDQTNAHFSTGRKTNYKRLGTLQLVADLPRFPTKEDGIIVLWLEPSNATPPLSSRPAHTIGISMRWHSPDRYGEVNTDGKCALPINLYGVTPGNYWVRGFWSTTTKSIHDIDVNFWTHTGDYLVAGDSEVNISKGEITSAAIQFQKSNAPDGEE